MNININIIKHIYIIIYIIIYIYIYTCIYIYIYNYDKLLDLGRLYFRQSHVGWLKTIMEASLTPFNLSF